ncbi:LuxR C-terminal-related transcriptional regulator [Streptomyces sp. NPDC051907]|uniref:helix-turn-helix transcriptional regulator n=1 Tax=Streptomyces sp. NPDC051907 TaxID=3155284 RepID=UPI0034308946
MAIAAVRHAQVVDALGRGGYEEALAWAGRVSPLGTLPYRSHHGPAMVMDVVEAAVRCGRADQVQAHLDAARRAELWRVSSRIALLVAGAEALCAPDEERATRFEEALSTDGAARWPFAYARVQLLYGEWLRRARDVMRARDQLWPALRALEALGAAPWAERARNELRATGLQVTHAGEKGALLTPQEAQIATLAGAGLTNKQIGERLNLSHRTVGSHLYKIFPKLGITSRAALRDALAAASSGADSARPPIA